MIVAVRRRRKLLRARDDQLERGDAACRVIPREQESHRERAQANGLLGRIGVKVKGLAVHVAPWAGWSHVRDCIEFELAKRAIRREGGWRRGGDSNPRYRFRPVRRFSKPLLSTTRPPLRESGLVSLAIVTLSAEAPRAFC